MAMKLLAVSIRDRKSEFFNSPFFVPNEAVAVRTFTQEVNRADDKNMLFTAAEDFELYVVGVFDDATGFLSPEMHEGNVRPRCIVVGSDVKRTIQ